MRSKRVIAFAVVGVALIMVLLNSRGAATDNKGKKAENEPIQVSVVIDYPNDDVILKDYEKKKAKLKEEMTVSEFIDYFFGNTKTKMEMNEDKTEITNINDVSKGEFYDTSHWEVKVGDKNCNGKFDETKIKDGDTIKFVFVEK